MRRAKKKGSTDGVTQTQREKGSARVAENSGHSHVPMCMGQCAGKAHMKVQ